jgi:predicted transcriptional regulator
MDSKRIPSISDVQAALSHLNTGQLTRLSELSGVPFTTIYKIKRGEVRNPGIGTVRKFAPHIEAAKG